MAGGHPVLDDETPNAAFLRAELAGLKRCAELAGYNVNAPAVQVALLELYAAKAQGATMAIWQQIAERVADELRRLRRGEQWG